MLLIAGILPAEALLHKKQLSLFGMITRLQDNILNNIARHILIAATDSTKSWFLQVKKLCTQYNLPHPITLLDNPYDKETFKTLVSNQILDF